MRRYESELIGLLKYHQIKFEYDNNKRKSSMFFPSQDIYTYLRENSGIVRDAKAIIYKRANPIYRILLSPQILHLRWRL